MYQYGDIFGHEVFDELSTKLLIAYIEGLTHLHGVVLFCFLNVTAPND